MGKFVLYSGNDSSSFISFESHLEGLEGEGEGGGMVGTKAVLLNLREFVKSLGNNVVEEVRPHRIVYAKSLTFRYFLDIQPRKDVLSISIRKSRKDLAAEHTIKNMQEMENIKAEIADAYAKI
jgi:hypothetical protein